MSERTTVRGYSQGFADGAMECDRLLAILRERYTAISITSGPTCLTVVTWQPGPRFDSLDDLLTTLRTMAGES